LNSPFANIVYQNFPFDCIKISGNDAVDFLQRISTNDFSGFKQGETRKTLLITDKGRVIDAVWISHRGEFLNLFCSSDMADDVISWLDKFIIMEDITLEKVSGHKIDLYSGSTESTDYFGMPASFAVDEPMREGFQPITQKEFERLRILNGIPKAKKELVRDFNPLELNLWDFISFTKGCYIGQEVIARLETYKKVQRSLCSFQCMSSVTENTVLLDSGSEVGKITSALSNASGKTIGLAVIRVKNLETTKVFSIKDSGGTITVDTIFQRK
jgi:tRNA-modifying protein YgfZ